MSIEKCKTPILKTTAKLSGGALKALILTSALAAGALAQETATVPFTVSVAATIKATQSGQSDVTATTSGNNTQRATLTLPVGDAAGNTSVSNPGWAHGPLNAPTVSGSRGNITLRLPSQSYQNAEIALHSVNGRRILSGRAAASAAVNAISRANVAPGVYLLSVKGADAAAFTARLTHSGGKLNINVAVGAVPALNKSAAVGNPWTIKITPTGTGYNDSTFSYTPDRAGLNDTVKITLRPKAGDGPALDKKNFTDTAKGTFSQAFNMIYVEGGTYTMGCEQSSNCPSGTTPTSLVTLHNYWIGETEVTTNLWRAVMGGNQSSSSGNNPYATLTWYEAQEFACRLGSMTGRTYRLATEAEWEYAAKGGKNGIGDKFRYSGSNTMSDVAVTGQGPSAVKSKSPNQLGIYDMSGNVDEWVYDSWLPDPTSAAKTNPVGPGGQIHTQKTRRGGYYGETDPTRQVAARRIRSIDGADGSIGFRIVYSEQLPPDMRAPCDIHPPEVGMEPTNSYRDTRWITDDDYEWRGGGDYTSGSIGESTFKLWADGVAYAKVGFAGTAVQGQWYTVNNVALVIVPNSGSRYRWPYIFMSDVPGEELISVISDKGFNGFIGRLKKVAKTSTINKPSVTSPQTGKELAAANSPADIMIDMENIPANVQVKDSRLLDGTSQGWFQDNTSMQGTHHYRKDVDNDVFRFAVILPQQNMTNLLAIGTWFTVGNTFLRVTASNGYTAEYLYAVTNDGEFHHVSYQHYERGDFRMFKKMANSEIFARPSELPTTGTPAYNSTTSCPGSQCGKSTFVPAPCPSGGCR